MTHPIFRLFAILFVLASAGRSFAHHSFEATYDSSQKIQIEGVIKEILWRNPHAFVRIDVVDKEGKVTTWGLEWSALTTLAKANITKGTLKPGDRLVVTGPPGRDPSNPRMLIGSVKRPSDGWSWQGTVD